METYNRAAAFYLPLKGAREIVGVMGVVPGGKDSFAGDEMPLLVSKLAAHASSGLVILGVLMDDPVDPAKTFMAQYGATWQTVVDPAGTIKHAYRVLNRPQSYFIDANGILRSIQIGYLTDGDFERQFALIAGS